MSYATTSSLQPPASEPVSRSGSPIKDKLQTQQALTSRVSKEILLRDPSPEGKIKGKGRAKLRDKNSSTKVSIEKLLADRREVVSSTREPSPENIEKRISMLEDHMRRNPRIKEVSETHFSDHFKSLFVSEKLASFTEFWMEKHKDLQAIFKPFLIQFEKDIMDKENRDVLRRLGVLRDEISKEFDDFEKTISLLKREVKDKECSEPDQRNREKYQKFLEAQFSISTNTKQIANAQLAQLNMKVALCNKYYEIIHSLIYKVLEPAAKITSENIINEKAKKDINEAVSSIRTALSLQDSTEKRNFKRLSKKWLKRVNQHLEFYLTAKTQELEELHQLPYSFPSLCEKVKGIFAGKGMSAGALEYYNECVAGGIIFLTDSEGKIIPGFVKPENASDTEVQMALGLWLQKVMQTISEELYKDPKIFENITAFLSKIAGKVATGQGLSPKSTSTARRSQREDVDPQILQVKQVLAMHAENLTNLGKIWYDDKNPQIKKMLLEGLTPMMQASNPKVVDPHDKGAAMKTVEEIINFTIFFYRTPFDVTFMQYMLNAFDRLLKLSINDNYYYTSSDTDSEDDFSVRKMRSIEVRFLAESKNAFQIIFTRNDIPFREYKIGQVMTVTFPKPSKQQTVSDFADKMDVSVEFNLIDLDKHIKRASHSEYCNLRYALERINVALRSSGFPEKAFFKDLKLEKPRRKKGTKAT